MLVCHQNVLVNFALDGVRNFTNRNLAGASSLGQIGGMIADPPVLLPVRGTTGELMAVDQQFFVLEVRVEISGKVCERHIEISGVHIRPSQLVEDGEENVVVAVDIGMAGAVDADWMAVHALSYRRLQRRSRDYFLFNLRFMVAFFRESKELSVFELLEAP